MIEIIHHEGSQRKVAEELYRKIQNTGRDFSLRPDRIRYPGSSFKTYFKIWGQNEKFGYQTISVMKRGIVLEGTGEESINDIKRIAGLN